VRARQARRIGATAVGAYGGRPEGGWSGAPTACASFGGVDRCGSFRVKKLRDDVRAVFGAVDGRPELVSITLGHPLVDGYLEFVGRGAREHMVALAMTEVSSSGRQEASGLIAADVFPFLAAQPRAAPRRTSRADRGRRAGAGGAHDRSRLLSVAVYEYARAQGRRGAANPVPRGLAAVAPVAMGVARCGGAHAANVAIAVAIRGRSAPWRGADAARPGDAARRAASLRGAWFACLMCSASGGSRHVWEGRAGGSCRSLAGSSRARRVSRARASAEAPTVACFVGAARELPSRRPGSMSADGARARAGLGGARAISRDIRA